MKNIKFLVVDDFNTMRRIIIGLLKECGFSDIQEAEDGDLALNLLNKEDFDFVITDWNMNRMHGIDLLKQIRCSERLKGLPVLMVTAEAKRENIILAAKEGADGYIVKPFSKSVLDEKLQKIMIKKGMV